MPQVSDVWFKSDAALLRGLVSGSVCCSVSSLISRLKCSISRAQRISGGSQQHCRQTGRSHSLHTHPTITQVTGRCYPRPHYTKAKSLPFCQGKSQIQEWIDRRLLSYKEVCECDRDCVYVCVMANLSSKEQWDEPAASQPDRIMTFKSILYMSNGEQIQICLMFQINASMFNPLCILQSQISIFNGHTCTCIYTHTHTHETRWKYESSQTWAPLFLPDHIATVDVCMWMATHCESPQNFKHFIMTTRVPSELLHLRPVSSSYQQTAKTSYSFHHSFRKWK